MPSWQRRGAEESRSQTCRFVSEHQDEPLTELTDTLLLCAKVGTGVLRIGTTGFIRHKIVLGTQRQAPPLAVIDPVTIEPDL